MSLATLSLWWLWWCSKSRWLRTSRSSSGRHSQLHILECRCVCLVWNFKHVFHLATILELFEPKRRTILEWDIEHALNFSPLNILQGMWELLPSMPRRCGYCVPCINLLQWSEDFQFERCISEAGAASWFVRGRILIFGDKHKDGATETTNFFVKF